MRRQVDDVPRAVSLQVMAREKEAFLSMTLECQVVIEALRNREQLRDVRNCLFSVFFYVMKRSSKEKQLIWQSGSKSDKWKKW